MIQKTRFVIVSLSWYYNYACIYSVHAPVQQKSATHVHAHTFSVKSVIILILLPYNLLCSYLVHIISEVLIDQIDYPSLIFTVLLNSQIRTYTLKALGNRMNQVDLLASLLKSHQNCFSPSALCVFRPFVNPTRSPAVVTASVECVLNESKLTTNIVQLATKRTSLITQIKACSDR